MKAGISKIDNFGERLEKIRKSRGLTQSELAQKIGTTQRMISHYESKVKSPPLDKIILIANTLQVSIDTLLGNNPIKYEFDPRIAKKIKLIQQLSERDQAAIWAFVNALVTKRELKEKNRKQNEES